MTSSQKRYELLRSRLARFTRTLHGVERGEIRAIHRARVASRRLRELLPLLQLDSPQARKLGKRLRSVTQELGPVRELDVLGLLIDELHDSGRLESRPLRRVAEVVRAERDERRQRISGKRIAKSMRRLADKLEAVSDALTQQRDQGARAWRWAIDARVARRAVVLRKAMTEAGAVYLPERLHQVRIALKKLRYGVELAAEAGAAGHGPDLAALKRVQGLLGRMHDVQVLIDRIRQVQAAHTRGDAGASHALDKIVIALDSSCRRLHARYMRERDALDATCLRLERQAAPRRRSGRHEGPAKAGRHEGPAKAVSVKAGRHDAMKRVS